MGGAAGGVYLRRVKNPSPLLEELARQVADLIGQQGRLRPGALAAAAALAGVPIAYVLDELERRTRAATEAR
jgi:hypothetical protein